MDKQEREMGELANIRFRSVVELQELATGICALRSNCEREGKWDGGIIFLNVPDARSIRDWLSEWIIEQEPAEDSAKPTAEPPITPETPNG